MWPRAENFILYLTDGNYFKAKAIFGRHDSMLEAGVADKDINTIFTFFHPFYVSYDNIYQTWSALRSSNSGNTKAVVNLVEELSGIQIRKWDVAIQGVFDLNSIEYKKILPNRRKPFQNGSVSNRVIELGNLSVALGKISALDPVAKQVAAFLDDMKSAIKVQKTQMTQIDSIAVALEVARVDAAEAMFKDYGSCIAKFYKTPVAIETYFPVALLTSKSQATFTITLEDTLPELLFKRKLDAKKKLSVINYGEKPIQLYFTNGLNKLPATGQTPGIVQGKDKVEINPADIFYSDTNRSLFISIADAGSPAYVEVTII